MAIGKEKADTMWDKDTLLHGEALLVVAASDAEDVAFPFITNCIGWNFLGDLLLVEDTARSLVNREKCSDVV